MPTDKKTNCIFCSLGCGLIIQAEGKRPLSLDYDADDPINRGSLCPRGNYMLELLLNPSRLTGSKIRYDRTVKDAGPDKALRELSLRLKDIIAEKGGNTVGVLLGPNLMNEDILSAFRFFRDVVGTKNIDVALPLEDAHALIGEDWARPFKLKEPSIGDIDQTEALLIIGDILERSPVLSQRINNVKYKIKGSKIIVVGPGKSHTSWFATNHLRIEPGAEALLLIGMIKALSEEKKSKAAKYARYLKSVSLDDISKKTGVPCDKIKKAANDFAAAKSGVILISSGIRDKFLVELSNLFASVAGQGKGLIAFYSSGNSIGAFKMARALRRPGGLRFAEIIDEASRGRLKALIMIGVDPLRVAPTEKLKRALESPGLTVVADVYRTSVMDFADITLPLASHMESSGAMFFSGGRLKAIDEVVCPAGGLTVKNMLKGISSELKGRKTLAFSPRISEEAKKIINGHKPKGKLSVSKLFGEAGKLKAPKKEKGFPFTLCLRDDIVHSSDGAITSKHYWAARECAMPYAMMNDLDALELNIQDGQRAIIKSEKSEIVVAVRVSSIYGRGIIAVPMHFQEVRELSGVKRSDEGGYFEMETLGVGVERISNG